MLKRKKIKSGETVVISNNGKKEVGVCKKVQTKKGITYYDVLSERGVWFENITDQPENIIHVSLAKLTPLNSGSKLEARINPDNYDFSQDEKVYFPPSSIDEI